MKEKCKGISLSLSRKVYSAEAVRLAAAVFAEKGGFSVSEAASACEVRFTGEGVSPGEFANEALNQQCRMDLAGRNGRLTNIVVTKALLSASGKRASKTGVK